MPNFYCLDEREIWHKAAIGAAGRAGYKGERIFAGDVVYGKPGDIGFLRPHADPRRLPANRVDFERMSKSLTMIQDAGQVQTYEDKSAQFARWGHWMPATWRFTDEAEALAFVAQADYPMVSKANEGASSTNVRVINTRAEMEAHIRQLFGKGVSVNHGASCPNSMQRGYTLLQRFIPHKITYRVNALGDARAVFFRRCYPDRPVAQTGNVEPAFEMTAELESLLAYCDTVFADIGSKWCALDVLKDGDQWRLLETSLAWPWPSPGRCNEGTIFRSPKGRKWIDMFDVMFDELEAGAWAQ